MHDQCVSTFIGPELPRAGPLLSAGQWSFGDSCGVAGELPDSPGCAEPPFLVLSVGPQCLSSGTPPAAS